jgi:hypothetical protein
MPQGKQSWTDYAKRMMAGNLGLAAAYALSSKNPKAKKTSEPKKKEKPKRKTKTLGQQAAGGLMRSKARYEQAARMSRGEY